MEVTTLKKRPEFLAVRGGPSAGTPGFLLQRSTEPASSGGQRVGFTVTRKIGKAVIRNRIRRRLKEAARRTFPTYGQAGFDYVVVARPAAAARDFGDLLDDMKRALLRLSAHPH